MNESSEITATESDSSAAERTGYDVIGDVHGCAAELEELLRILDYRVTVVCLADRVQDRDRVATLSRTRWAAKANGTDSAVVRSRVNVVATA